VKLSRPLSEAGASLATLSIARRPPAMDLPPRLTDNFLMVILAKFVDAKQTGRMR
jgi:hypothetical protein